METPVEEQVEGSTAKKWYVVHAYSGFEKNVARTLKERVELSDLKEYFGDILVPTPDGTQIPLSELSKVTFVRGPMVSNLKTLSSSVT